jgi:hypothetical protein
VLLACFSIAWTIASREKPKSLDQGTQGNVGITCTASPALMRERSRRHSPGAGFGTSRQGT